MEMYEEMEELAEAFDEDEDSFSDDELGLDEAIESDDELDDDGDDVMELGEMVDFGEARGRRRSRDRRRPRARAPQRWRKPQFGQRARPVKGFKVRTPAGRATVRFQGGGVLRFKDYNRSINAVRRDMRATSMGLKDLTSELESIKKRVGRFDRGLEKKVFGLQVGVIALAALSLPQTQSLIQSITNNS